MKGCATGLWMVALAACLLGGSSRSLAQTVSTDVQLLSQPPLAGHQARSALRLPQTCLHRFDANRTLVHRPAQLPQALWQLTPFPAKFPPAQDLADLQLLPGVHCWCWGWCSASLHWPRSWLKRLAPHRFQALPDAAVCWIGKRVIATNQELHLVRVGAEFWSWALVPTACDTLSEITDPTEMAHLEIAARHPAAPQPTRRPISKGAAAAEERLSAVDEAALPSATDTRRTGRTRSAMGLLFAGLTLSSVALAQSPISTEPVPDRAAFFSNTSAVEAGSRTATVDGTTTVPIDPVAGAAISGSASPPPPLSAGVASAPLGPPNLWSTIRMAALVSVVSLAPAIILMTTCYVRIVIVLGLLRQAIGTPQFPPTQLLTASACF